MSRKSNDERTRRSTPSRRGGGTNPRKGKVAGDFVGDDWVKNWKIGELDEAEMRVLGGLFGVRRGGEEVDELDESEENDVER